MKALKKLFKKDKATQGKAQAAKHGRLNVSISRPVLVEKPGFSSPNEAYLIRTKRQHKFLHHLPVEILQQVFQQLHCNNYNTIRQVCRLFDDLLGPQQWNHLQLDLANCLAGTNSSTTVQENISHVGQESYEYRGQICIKTRTELGQFYQALTTGVDKMAGVKKLSVSLPSVDISLADYDLTGPGKIIQRTGNDAYVNWMFCWLLDQIIPQRCHNLEQVHISRQSNNLDYEPAAKLLKLNASKKITLGPQATTNIASIFTNVKSLRLLMSAEMHLHPEARCPALESLELVYQSNGRVPASQMKSFLRKFPSLSRLQVYGIMVCSSADQEEKWLPGTVKQLEVGGVEPLDNQLMLYDRVHTLKILDNVVGRTLLHHMVFPNLKSVSLADQLINDKQKSIVTMPGTNERDTLPDFESRHGLSIPLNFFPDTLKEVQTQFGSLATFSSFVKRLPNAVERLVLFDSKFQAIDEENENDEMVLETMREICASLKSVKHLFISATNYPFHLRTSHIVQSFIKHLPQLETLHLFFNHEPLFTSLTPVRFQLNDYATIDAFKVDMASMQRELKHRRWKSLISFDNYKP